MELHSKAWAINTSNFSEPHFAPDGVYYGENRSKVRATVLKDIRYDDYKDREGNDIGFLNLNLRREKEYDKFLVDGKLKTKADIDYDQRVRERDERLNKLLADNPGAMAYIKKGGAFYRPNCCGYTDRRFDAGVYTLEKAVREVIGCSLGDNMDAILIDPIQHNEMIQEKIDDLTSKLI